MLESFYFVGATGATAKKDVVQMHSTTRAFAALQADGKVVTWGAAGTFDRIAGDGGYAYIRHI